MDGYRFSDTTPLYCGNTNGSPVLRVERRRRVNMVDSMYDILPSDGRFITHSDDVPPAKVLWKPPGPPALRRDRDRITRQRR